VESRITPGEEKQILGGGGKAEGFKRVNPKLSTDKGRRIRGERKNKKKKGRGQQLRTSGSDKVSGKKNLEGRENFVDKRMEGGDEKGRRHKEGEKSLEHIVGKKTPKLPHLTRGLKMGARLGKKRNTAEKRGPNVFGRARKKSSFCVV